MTHVGGWVAFLCMIFSAQFAVAFLFKNSRLFTAMALFACSWALVTFNYGMIENEILMQSLNETLSSLSENVKNAPSNIDDVTKDTFSKIKGMTSSSEDVIKKIRESKGFIIGISSFLYIFVGGLLMLEGKSVKSRRDTLNRYKDELPEKLKEKISTKKEREDLEKWVFERYMGLLSEVKHLKVDWLQIGALIFLIALLVVPKAYSIPSISDRLTEHQMSVVWESVADVIGFACLGWGAWWLASETNPDETNSILKYIRIRWPFVILTFTLLLYSIFELVYHYNYNWSDLLPPRWILIVFAVLKVILTAFLGGIVAYHGMPREIRAKGWRYWVILSIPIPIPIRL